MSNIDELIEYYDQFFEEFGHDIYSNQIIYEEYQRYLELLRQRDEQRLLNTNLEESILNEFGVMLKW